MNYFICYLVGINVIAFFAYGFDKFFSKRNWWRIREDVLIVFGLFGGVIGAFLGMFLFRHKTKKKKFYIWNFIWLILWIYLVLCYLK